MGAPPAASKGCPKGDVTSGGRATVRAVLVNRVDPSQFLRVARNAKRGSRWAGGQKRGGIGPYFSPIIYS